MANIFNTLNPLNWVKDLIQPVTDLIDNLHTSDAERDEAKIRLLEVTHELQTRLLDFETDLVKAQSKIIITEAQGGWLAASWRPITALTFTFIIAWNYILQPIFSMVTPLPRLDIPPDMWTLLTVMIGGYVGSRGIEKTVRELIKWKAKE